MSLLNLGRQSYPLGCPSVMRAGAIAGLPLEPVSLLLGFVGLDPSVSQCGPSTQECRARICAQGSPAILECMVGAQILSNSTRTACPPEVAALVAQSHPPDGSGRRARKLSVELTGHGAKAPAPSKHPRGAPPSNLWDLPHNRLAGDANKSGCVLFGSFGLAVHDIAFPPFSSNRRREAVFIIVFENGIQKKHSFGKADSI